MTFNFFQQCEFYLFGSIKRFVWQCSPPKTHTLKKNKKQKIFAVFEISQTKNTKTQTSVQQLRRKTAQAKKDGNELNSAKHND